MAAGRKSLVRWLVTFVILAAISVGGFYYVYQRAGDAIKSEMLKVVDDIGFTAEDRAAVNGFIADAHGEAFRHALDVTRTHGRKFDEQLYFNEIFDNIIDRAREDGMDRVADTLGRERVHFSLTVTEE